MLKRSFFLFIFLFFLVINYSVSEVKIDFFERAVFFSLFIALFFVFRQIDLGKLFCFLTSIVSTLLFSYGIIQKYILFPIYLKSMDSGISAFSLAMKERVISGRIFSIFSLPTLYTFICAILLLAIFHYLINSKSTVMKVFWTILFFAGVFNIILTQSFSGILYLLAGFPIYLILSGRSGLKFLLPLFMTLSMFFFIVIGLRFSEAKKFEPLKLRISNWHQAVRIIESSPVLGIGLGNYESKIARFTLPGEARSIYSHNFLLQFSAEGGIIILILGIAVMIMFRKSIKPEFSKDNALYLSLLLIVIIYNLIDIGLYFFSAALLFTLIISQVYKKKVPSSKTAVALTILLIFVQLLSFYSSSLRRTGSFHLNFNRFGEAERYFRKSLSFNKFNYKSSLGLAKIAYSKKDFLMSDMYLKRTLSLNGLIPYAHFLRSRIKYNKKEYLSSFYHSGKSISFNKRNREYRKWYDFLRKNLITNLKDTGTGKQ